MSNVMKYDEPLSALRLSYISPGRSGNRVEMQPDLCCLHLHHCHYLPLYPPIDEQRQENYYESVVSLGCIVSFRPA